MIVFYGEILGVPNTPLTGDLSEYNCPIWAPRWGEITSSCQRQGWERSDQGQDSLGSEARHGEAAVKEQQAGGREGLESLMFILLEMHSSGDSVTRRGLWSPTVPISFFKATSKNKKENGPVNRILQNRHASKQGFV